MRELAVNTYGYIWSTPAADCVRRLADLGYQYRNERDEWELTEVGRTWGEALPFSRNGHSGYQILWKLDVADRLKEVA